MEIEGGQRTTKTAAELGMSVEDNAGTGGERGSFVYDINNSLLIASGGEAVHPEACMEKMVRLEEMAPVARLHWATIGDMLEKEGRGNPGQCNTQNGNYHGGVGGGWLDKGCARSGTSHGETGGSRLQGWVGGLAGRMNSGNNGGPSPGAVGGFGGWGGGAEDNGASGGGEGFSGGGSGVRGYVAKGGGSHCGGESCSGVTCGNPFDYGMVIIQEEP